MTYGKAFWLDAMERALKTAAQCPIAAWGAAKVSNVFDLDIKSAFGTAAFGFLLSLLMSVASAPVGKDNSASLVPKSLLLPFLLLLGLFGLGGCTTTPVSSANELRVLYKEVQAQVNEAKADPNVNQAKLSELEDRVQDIGLFIDQIEIAAAAAEQNPGKYIDFQTLYVMYKPKVEGLLINLVLRRYLGS